MQYYHGNHLNSASVVTDGEGNTKETIEYHPYGTYRLRTDLDAAFPNGTGNGDVLQYFNWQSPLRDIFSLICLVQPDLMPQEHCITS
ncbi:MAG: hypothetical protein PHU49_06170 [Syntrophorhabdaceae bacterium]|nr:hypothetical protein [Syntrophorhabdaceae bacterium]MDD5243586.1 hypothetical protein [Syntrophorhabdaceae bacterium]